MNNVKTGLKSSGRYRWIIVFEAILVTVAFHLLLLGLFRYVPPQEIKKTNHSNAIVMFNLNTLTPEQQKYWNNWLSYHDPALTVLPNRKYGYSSHNLLTAPQKPLPLVKPNWRSPAKAIPALPGFEPLPVKNLEHLLPDQQVFNYFSDTMLKTAESKAAVSADNSQAYVLFNDRIVPELSYDVSWFPQSKSNALSVLILELTSSPANNLMPRFEIIQSSGNAELDSLTVRNILQNYERIKHLKQPLNIKINWQKGQK